jgi:hypothetical protein
MVTFKKLLQENKRKVQFEQAGWYVPVPFSVSSPLIICRFEDDNSHLAVMTQVVVQDIIWLDDAVNNTLAKRLPVYFVPRGSSDITFYVIAIGE